MSHYLLSLLTISLLVCSCGNTPKFELEEDPGEIVVVSNFNLTKDIKVFVSKSRSILGDQSRTEYVDNAVVELYKGKQYLETLSIAGSKGDGYEAVFYTSNTFQPEEDVLYTIKVQVPGYEEVTAKSRIPSSIQLVSLEIASLKTVERPDGKASLEFDLNLQFEDPAEEINYYHINLMQQYHPFFVVEEDTIFDPSSAYMETVIITSKINSNNEVAHISGGVLLKDQPFNGKIISYTLPVNLVIDPQEEIPGNLFVDLRTVSEEYYLYFDALSRQDESDDTPFTPPVFLFDNIEGGKGVFAGYNSSLDSLQIQN